MKIPKNAYLKLAENTRKMCKICSKLRIKNFLCKRWEMATGPGSQHDFASP